ncbi:hypothetical protein FRX31_031374 [Thalictrum thalictroides]|uniref:C3H1-type domain-containing protein n=1 Tax=Thalictrum thalictroides TaxID=46969 RepID=A0A7J6V2L3_THATH|nr:hypothetical protein FRX31_031374 [Thalictrum thalictroides]
MYVKSWDHGILVHDMSHVIISSESSSLKQTNFSLGKNCIAMNGCLSRNRIINAKYASTFNKKEENCNDTEVQLEKLKQKFTQSEATNVTRDFSSELEMMRPRLPVAPPLNEINLKNCFQLLKMASETLCEMTKENEQLKMENLYLLSLTISDENEPQVDLAAHGQLNTSLCDNWKRNLNRSCHLNERCRYAHGPYQLKIKTCDIFLKQGSCPYEEVANFYMPMLQMESEMNLKVCIDEAL